MPTLILQGTRFTVLLTASLIATLATNFSAPAFAADPAVTTDIGTLDQETAEKAFAVDEQRNPVGGRCHLADRRLEFINENRRNYASAPIVDRSYTRCFRFQINVF